ncbi:MAG: sulfatase-like hydrolase/transferase [Halioglobus sp.]|nr:sulfatase-like hydrolase/transferase [Halioglobus sp.]
MEFRSLSFGFGHFLTLFSLSVAQPIFDMLGKNVQFFLFRESTMLEITLYAILVGLLVPLGLFLVTNLLGRLNRRLGSLLFGTWTVVFFALFALLLAKNAGIGNSFLLIGLALIASIVAAFYYYRRGIFYRVVGYMVIIAVVAPLLFLWNSYSSLRSEAGAGSGTITVENADTPVFVLVFDELPLSVLLDRNREIDGRRYPNFARLNATATWYKNASTITDATALAIPAILTGNKPAPTAESFDISPTAVNYPRNLFSMLSATHNIYASETITRLCPDSICSDEPSQTISRSAQLSSAAADTVIVYLYLVSPEIFLQYLPPINSNWGGFQGDSLELEIVGLFYNEVNVHKAFSDISRAKQNDVHFIHMNMPHHPWIYYASGKRYRPSYFVEELNPLGIEWMNANGHLWSSNKDELAVARRRQSLQIAYSDKLLGEFLDAIEESGNFENALIIVVADHGSNIAPDELFRWATQKNVADLMSIPLWVKYPRQVQPEANSLNAENTDILPTIADVLGVEHNWSIDGYSLRNLAAKPEESKTILRTIPFTSTDENKSRPRLITVSDSNIFDKIWRDESVRVTGDDESIFLYDRSYDTSWLGISTASLNKMVGERVAEVRGLGHLRKMDLSIGYLPGYLRMRIPKLSNSEEFMVAIALNGVVRITRYVSADNPGDIEAILPEKAIVEGKNHLEVFVYNDSGADGVFEELEVKNWKRE